MALVVSIEAAPVTLEVDRYIAESTVQILMPFLREAVANLTLRGRFGPVWLQPISGRALAAKMREEADTEAAPRSGRPTLAKRGIKGRKGIGAHKKA
jgi:preprotein translocase subunit SecB